MQTFLLIKVLIFNYCNVVLLKLSRVYIFNISSNFSFLIFGDTLHTIHPLAGQGFNMTMRDIKMLSSLIDEKIELGLDLDNSLFYDFQKKN